MIYVSISTIPQRIKNLNESVKSLLNQTLKPDKILPNYYINIFYEELINNQKEQTEKLLNACNLEWSENCIQFYNNKHFMSTGSNSINIHQPIYKTSMQYWKCYEKQLQPLLEILKT